MSVYYCNICDRTIKLIYKKKYLNTKLHRDLFTSIVNRYCVKNPPTLKKDVIFKKTRL